MRGLERKRSGVTKVMFGEEEVLNFQTQVRRGRRRWYEFSERG